MLKSIVKNIVKSEIDRKLNGTARCVVEGVVAVLTKK